MRQKRVSVTILWLLVNSLVLFPKALFGGEGNWQDNHNFKGASPAEKLKTSIDKDFSYAVVTDGDRIEAIYIFPPGQNSEKNGFAEDLSTGRKPFSEDVWIHEGFLDVLRADDASSQAYSFEILEGAGKEELNRLLFNALSEPEDRIVVNAIDLIGEIGDESASEALIHKLHSQNSEIRISAIEALAEINAYEAAIEIEAIISSTDDEDLREIAMDALSELEANKAAQKAE